MNWRLWLLILVSAIMRYCTLIYTYTTFSQVNISIPRKRSGLPSAMVSFRCLSTPPIPRNLLNPINKLFIYCNPATNNIMVLTKHAHNHTPPQTHATHTPHHHKHTPHKHTPRTHTRIRAHTSHTTSTHTHTF